MKQASKVNWGIVKYKMKQKMATPSANIPILSPMNKKDNVAESWQIFLEQWKNYEIATVPNAADCKVRIANILSALGSDAFHINWYLPPADAERKEF